MHGSCPWCAKMLATYVFFLVPILVSNPARADQFYPSNVWPPQSFSTLEAAEAAMRAVNADAALLQFDRILGTSGNWTYRVYTVPPLAPNPPAWSNWCNVPGDYASGQAVCDARRTWINWANPLTYIPDPPQPQLL